ncbi:3-oxoacyl-ACP synthase III family protein [Streptomyces violascens]|uniref:3-oxoacyl-[acyl-carrier-protein] synthase 3 n=1 Tax=Streptomyces violascens TaxID=67381 RepID=A0ABQ3QSN4_9ACTN|nr:ketoacyl-ACP synthase III [Streptomyces violascens]GGU33184.1 3-oxoacyl-[acyl-carrier-protein] synthase 3 [Streptomyces violascens]GHI40245.1 3-oxoacyl-[acyl-carrier-protein] synthase 3 [Streptomyces violascens]
MNRSLSHSPIGIRGMGSYLPQDIRSNEEVARRTGVTADWIRERTGVRARHVAAPDEAASDLAASAVRAAATAAGIDAADISLLICATSTPDELGPATACRVQALLKAEHAVALDVSAACSGWLFAIKVAHDWLRADHTPRYAAVVGVEVYSKFLDPEDRATSVLFADGAAAAILGPVGPDEGFQDFDFGSDGTLADQVLIPAGGSRLPADATTLADKGHCIHMDGRSVSHFISATFPRLVHESLARNRLSVSDIDCLVAHQPNPVLLHRLGRQLGIDIPTLVIVGDEVGNIGAASAPYALTAAAGRHALRPKDRVLITVFGAGMTWGSALLTWSGAPAVRIAPTRSNLPERERPRYDHLTQRP